MLFLIISQKDRSLGSILYDHHNTEKLNPDQICYTKRELRMRIIARSVFGTFMVFQSAAFIFRILSSEQYMNYYILTVYTLMAFLLYSCFFCLYFTMKKYHNFEYKKLRKAHCMYIWCAIVYYVLMLAYNILIELYMRREGITGYQRNTQFVICTLE